MPRSARDPAEAEHGPGLPGAAVAVRGGAHGALRQELRHEHGGAARAPRLELAAAGKWKTSCTNKNKIEQDSNLNNAERYHVVISSRVIGNRDNGNWTQREMALHSTHPHTAHLLVVPSMFVATASKVPVRHPFAAGPRARTGCRIAAKHVRAV